ncbi:MAG TPA: hypothetical protein VEC19_12265 [Usitatibacter sp.]|nr:hypothetical protein [Usitatibacter sp.]
MGRDEKKAREKYSETANNPPRDRRKPPPNTAPGSHSTGGRKDHAQPGEGEAK